MQFLDRKVIIIYSINEINNSSVFVLEGILLHLISEKVIIFFHQTCTIQFWKKLQASYVPYNIISTHKGVTLVVDNE